MLTLLAGAGVAVAVLATGLVLAVVHAVRPASGPTDSASASDPVGSAPASTTAPTDRVALEDSLAARPMPVVPESASHPGPVSDRDPGAPILLPPATSIGPAGVPTGFPRTPEGALAQLAAIDQVALQSASLAGARAVISAWAMPGGPTTTSWSGVRAVGRLLDAAGLSGGGSTQFAVVLTPLMGLIKGSVGSDFVVACVDFQLDVTLQRTARGAVADCQRMVWRTDRWLIGPGAEPATPPSVWPGTDVAFSVGYRDLRHE
ncbi:MULTISPECIES: hypothetical protein [unclassified Modestobacter]|uniref:hypothetical protein n=1 Tax=unclassified Modestobacter TaxID=2643866 RepID=UPI0022AB44F5|nr:MULTISPECIES: hypothetical protein [unclassified Modestobacter]MCZ2812035.1 hypothetical protein [Modestobacter sp. VKM Ac-2979]MCZ2843759.1 hypothetical protein [Modestobacter sp. VKM Ac-2980]MCZ2849796.1 hypothetical protein [Modestobacter sp. VKM Ac-2978]